MISICDEEREGKTKGRGKLTFYQFSLKICLGLLQRGKCIHVSNLSLDLPLCNERAVLRGQIGIWAWNLAIHLRIDKDHSSRVSHKFKKNKDRR